MFDNIEREYKKGLQAKRFTNYYWPRVIVIIVAAILLTLSLNNYRWLIYGCAVVIFALIVALFFLKEYRRMRKNYTNNPASYTKADNSKRIENLVSDLERHNLHTKSDIKLALDYFESRMPVNTRPRLLDWIFTTVIALVSIVILTYDNTINTINLHRLVAVFAPSLVVALIILTPFIIARLIYTGIARAHNKLDTSLVQDLAYIYVNFKKYQKQLETKNPSQD